MKWLKKLTPEEIAAKEENDQGFKEWLATTRIIDTDTGRFYASSKEMKADWPFKRRVKSRIKNAYKHHISRPLNDLKYWFLYRFHPKYRYHVVKTGLGYGYYDTDTRMEAAIIKLFIDYVEIEKPFEHFDTEDPHHREDWRKIKGLYEYFKNIDVLNQPHQQYERSVEKLTNESYEEYTRTSNKLSREFTERLCEVVRLRGHYWT